MDQDDARHDFGHSGGMSYHHILVFGKFIWIVLGFVCIGRFEFTFWRKNLWDWLERAYGNNLWHVYKLFL